MPDPAERRESHEVPAEIASLAAEADSVAAATGNAVAAEVADTIAAVEHHPPRRLVLRIVIALVVVAALLLAGWRSGLYKELYRLRQAPPGLVALMAALWLASRYPAADVMRVALRALGHHIGRFEAFMLQMIQSYGNVIVPRAGIGLPALYLKAHHGVSFADLSAVQLLPMSLIQLVTIGVVGLASQLVLWRVYGRPLERPLSILFGAVAVGCVTPLLVPLPANRTGRGRITNFLARLATAWQRLGRSGGLLVRVVITHTAMLLLRAWRIQFCFAAVGTPVHYLGALAASLLADLAFGISVTPGALGFREGAIVYAARVLNTTGDIAMAAAVLDRLISLACTVVVGQLGVWQFISPLLRGTGARSRE
jgi:uncharacterized membrane protein YbhN (UPF0104 family)